MRREIVGFAVLLSSGLTSLAQETKNPQLDQPQAVCARDPDFYECICPGVINVTCCRKGSQQCECLGNPALPHCGPP